MKRVTGTHFYTWLTCPHAVWLDMHGDRALRRARTEVEELVLRRGRELEDRLVEPLGYSTPEFPERDYEAGAQATLELMREGVDGLLQAVLLGDGQLGIPDLMRRQDGGSELGDHHYVIGDVKSSAQPRSDQILQIMFYTRLLAGVQGRAPDHAYLVLRDGHEEQFLCADYEAALDEVDRRIAEVADQSVPTRSFLSRSCASCHWSELCLPDLEKRDDLSLLQGMTRGLRQTLEAAGVSTCQAVRGMTAEAVARRTHIETALLRRLKKAASAREHGRPIPQKRAKGGNQEDVAVVHLLGDAFAERVYYIGILYPATPDGSYHEAFPSSRERELSDFLGLTGQIPAGVSLWHYGAKLPRWYEEAAWRKHASIELESRMVDLARRLRGAACYPAPVFGLDGHVQFGLQRDPHRCGEAGAVPLWLEEGDAQDRLRAKGRSDLGDLAALIENLHTAFTPTGAKADENDEADDTDGGGGAAARDPGGVMMDQAGGP